jgi:PIN domain nuclease of toxin-antitoxin system
MRLLLDTHFLLWAAGLQGRIPAAGREMMADPGNKLVFSVASLWEISIKHALGRAGFRADPTRLRRGLRNGGYEELTITGEHALAAGGLPPIHRDPFDRMLVAQATVEGLVLLTVDATIATYPGPVRKV